MQTHASILRAIAARSIENGPRHIDPDLDREAGMDGILGRLLQAARDLDDEADAAEAWAAQQDREAAEAGPDHY
jgi:hypothetical protein